MQVFNLVTSSWGQRFGFFRLLSDCLNQVDPATLSLAVIAVSHYVNL